MADTRVQSEVEDWVTKEWLPKQLGRPFHRDRVKLSSGGVFDFDAVSQDESVVASISTSSSHTAGGKYGVGKMMKIRSDMFFLMLTSCERRLIVLTEKDMYDQCLKEKAGGRVPAVIEFMPAEIPRELAERLAMSRARASKEVTPKERSSE